MSRNHTILQWFTAVAVQTLNSSYNSYINQNTPNSFSYSYQLHPQAFIIKSGLPLLFEIRHHHPDHKGNGSEVNNENSNHPFELNSTTFFPVQENLPSQLGSQPPDPNYEIYQKSGNNFQNILPQNVGRPPSKDINLRENPQQMLYSIPLATQFHEQNGLGQLHQYDYPNPGSAQYETKSSDDVIRGAYTFIDSNEGLQYVSHKADDNNGYRIKTTKSPNPHAEKYPSWQKAAIAKSRLL